MGTDNMLELIWKDKQFGRRSAKLWFVLIGLPFLFVLELFDLDSVISRDFKHDLKAEIIFIFISIAIGFYCFMGIAKILYARFQPIEFCIGCDDMSITCWLSKYSYQLSELSSTGIINNKFLSFFSYLSNNKKNYYLTFKDGERFYISGDMPEVDSLIATLQEIIQSNRNP